MLERRESRRFRVLKGATIIVGTATVIDCVVRNLTNSGARILLSGAVNLPEIVDITLDGGHTFRPCRLVWRSTDAMGVEFIKPKRTTYSRPIDTTLTPCPRCGSAMIHIADTPHPVAREMQRSVYLCRPCNRTQTYILPASSASETSPSRPPASAPYAA
jgi:PilZ domain-containing protein